MYIQSITYSKRSQSRNGLKGLQFLIFLILMTFLTPCAPLSAGSYTDSAHGSNSDGVDRSVIGDSPPAGFGYAKGNCAHCHEQHASIEGGEPSPSTGPASYALFAPFFDTSTDTDTGPYTEDDNFCFYCHNSSGSAQNVINYTYSMNFGCETKVATSIFETMNQTPGSYHNLQDIYNYAYGKFSWFTSKSNPCSACHNPHLAKRNWANPKDPTYSAIVKPSDHFTLWGTTDTMGSVYQTKYEPPLCSGSLKEPADSSDAIAGRAATPDYVGFCTVCHDVAMDSTTLGRSLNIIDWAPGVGDKHGERPMNGGIWIESPYGSGGDYVLSCLDCHEPHGSENVMLLRSRVNGGELGDSIDTVDTSNWGYLCTRCHLDDQDLGGSTPNKWGNVHHFMSDAPYSTMITPIDDCTVCHDGAGGTNCQNCHYHGADILIEVGDNTGDSRRTF